MTTGENPNQSRVGAEFSAAIGGVEVRLRQ
jgi:hypothetical protein